MMSVVPSARWHDDGTAAAGILHSKQAVTTVANFIADRRGRFFAVDPRVQFTEAFLFERKVGLKLTHILVICLTPIYSPQVGPR